MFQSDCVYPLVARNEKMQAVILQNQILILCLELNYMDFVYWISPFQYAGNTPRHHPDWLTLDQNRKKKKTGHIVQQCVS